MEDNLYKFLGEEIKDVKGQDAIYALIKRQAGYVKNAFRRDDIGYINLIWGDENRGLCHIINRRIQQNINIDDFLADLTNVIENGQFVKINNKGRYEIFYNGKMAVIEPEITNGKMTFLLTAFKRRRP